MKKILLSALPLVLLVLGVAGNSLALTIAYEETYNPGANYLMDAKATGLHLAHTWTFDITDNAGWDTAGQTFNDGTITLSLQDNSDSATEKATFTFNLGTGTTKAEKLDDINWIFTVLANSFNDGKVEATLTAANGDFYFNNAKLNVTSNYEEVATLPGGDNGGPGAAVVPEPGTLSLLGLGLAGLAVALRRRKG